MQLSNRAGLLFPLTSVLVLAVGLGSGYVGFKFGALYQRDADCCQLPLSRSVAVSAKEKLGLVTFYSSMGQDKWVSESVFPGVTNGFFLEVGSGDGTVMSNTKALEQKGWTGICVDPFPKNMQDRTCQVFKEVVFSDAGQKVQFFAHPGLWSGIVDTLIEHPKGNDFKTTPVMEFTTVTLRDILERAKAPWFIHYVSLDIEGGELNALKGFPFDKYQIGALTVEHNYQEPRRTDIRTLLERHGYTYRHTSVRDDFFVRAHIDDASSGSAAGSNTASVP